MHDKTQIPAPLKKRVGNKARSAPGLSHHLRHFLDFDRLRIGIDNNRRLDSTRITHVTLIRVLYIEKSRDRNEEFQTLLLRQIRYETC